MVIIFIFKSCISNSFSSTPFSSSCTPKLSSPYQTVSPTVSAANAKARTPASSKPAVRGRMGGACPTTTASTAAQATATTYHITHSEYLQRKRSAWQLRELVAALAAPAMSHPQRKQQHGRNRSFQQQLSG